MGRFARRQWLRWFAAASRRIGWLLALAGCVHAPDESAPAQNAQAAATAAPASAKVAPRGGDQARARPVAGTESIASFMGDHFVISLWARDAVIGGDLELLREPLRALAEYRYDSVVLGGWALPVAQLQRASGLVARARDLHVAAAGVAAMARICGDCHAAKTARSEPELLTRRPAWFGSASFSQRMFSHEWAADQLWHGLTDPSDAAWNAGAAALARMTIQRPEQIPGGMASDLAAVQDLGMRASGALDREQRTNVYALVIATCADCHAAIEGHEGPPAERAQ